MLVVTPSTNQLNSVFISKMGQGVFWATMQIATGSGFDNAGGTPLPVSKVSIPPALGERNGNLLLAHRLRRWPSSKPTLGQHLMFAGMGSIQVACKWVIRSENQSAST